MKKEKSSLTQANLQAKSGLTISTVNTSKVGEGGEGSPAPSIKSDPDGQGNPVSNGENSTTPGCDSASPPPSAGGEAEGGSNPASQEEKKPPLTPNDLGGVVKSETDSFLESFDTKDGGNFTFFLPLFVHFLIYFQVFIFKFIKISRGKLSALVVF